MNETEEQRAYREAAERRYHLTVLAGYALTGLIAHYAPADKPEATAEENRTVNRMTAEQIKECAVTAYELADATLQAIELGESAPAPQE